MTLFEWLRDILRRAASIGRFWYSLREKRTIVDVVFEDESVASVKTAQAKAERVGETGTMAKKFVTLYQGDPQPPDDAQSAAPGDGFADSYYSHEEKEGDVDDESRRSDPAPELPSPFD